MRSIWRLQAHPSTGYFRSTNCRRAISTKQLDLNAVDAKWLPRWRDHAQWSNPQAPKGKYFVMPMFPYPSGALHIGHLRNYTISDVIARYRRMSGYHVLHPIGWDAFGLPAENAAIERGVNPAAWTSSNIANMKQQIESMGGCWDWDKELRTCDPSFYRDTQWLFLQLLKHGVAYQDEAVVNYDPVDKTVLANEQVDSNGLSWRSGAKVEQVRLRQWFVRITDYAQDLLEDLEVLGKENKWPARVLAMQKYWLGRSEGAELAFDVCDHKSGQVGRVEVFTTRADTLFGAQYLALALDHPLVQRGAKEDDRLKRYLDGASALDANDKNGYRLHGLTARNPINRLLPKEQALEDLPVFAASYVRSDYASGAVMGVPAHDVRDFDFWNTNRDPSQDSEARQVIMNSDAPTRPASLSEALTVRGTLMENCLTYAGLNSNDAAKKIIADLKRGGDEYANPTVNWRMRDWLISRQRYWGTPIPVIHCESCGAVPVPESDLPVELPILSDEQWKDMKGNALEADPEWVATMCPQCEGPARRETDTMDTFVDSSWYFLKFARSAEEENGVSFMPVDVYIGGVEHAILHLLYARFVSKFLSKTTNKSELAEPFRRLITQGMVHGKTYSDAESGRFLKPNEVDLSDAKAPTIIRTGLPAVVSFEKMSKSKHNGVDPLSCMATYGADTTRAHLLFQAPVSDVLDWDEAKISGIQRWFNRVWALAHHLATTRRHGPIPDTFEDMSHQKVEMWKQTQLKIISVNRAYGDDCTLNTVVSDLMTLTNTIQQQCSGPGVEPSLAEQRLVFESFSILLRLLTPVAPSFAEECWSVAHNLQELPFSIEKTASFAGFPMPDGSLDRLQARTQPCAVQVNGKLKFVAQVPTPPGDVTDKALKEWLISNVTKSPEGSDALLKGKFSPGSARKIIIVRGGRTLNFVT